MSFEEPKKWILTQALEWTVWSDWGHLFARQPCLIGLRLLICEADNGKNVSRESKTGAHHHQHSHKPEPDLIIFRMLAWCQWHPNSPFIHSRTEGISPPRVKERLVNWNTADVLPKKFSRGDTFCNFIKNDFSGFRYLSAHNKGAICFLSRCNYSWAIIWKSWKWGKSKCFDICINLVPISNLSHMVKFDFRMILFS